ncbi:MAG: hypothetical protein JRJ84_12835 [Deltaproteobacteria bacterium]|nr:hypothetical protein [Deltaproteobacteria bacterium]
MPGEGAEDRLSARLGKLLQHDERPIAERRDLVRLMLLFARLPPPPDPYGLFPRYPELKDRYLDATMTSDAEILEERFLALYSHVHGYEVPYTPEERQRFDASGGHLCHVGGLSPILKARAFVGPNTVSVDFGAGNGLQGLLLQTLFPHRKVVQIELSSRLVEAGRHLQDWLGIDDARVEWIVGDVRDISLSGMDFVYLYRPLRPTGPGERFYERLAADLESADRSVVIFSVADCLGPHLSSRFEVLFTDGHLTCFRRVDRALS